MQSEYDDLEFELLFINDGSKDNTLKMLRELSASDNRVRYISFSRNFGKEAGMFAGMENSKGDYLWLWTPIFSIRLNLFLRCINM